jgi:precorrin-2/cobalt-factor-2 C20-methyltransferase
MGVEEAVSGRLYGIGVGPGDPELMTLKAVRILSEVQVVAYPAPAPAGTVLPRRHPQPSEARAEDPEDLTEGKPGFSGLRSASPENDGGEDGAGQSSARRIAAEFIPAGRTEIAIKVPMRVGPVPLDAYARAADEIAVHLEAGRDVAVLCEGDPFFYGSFMYLHDLLSPRFSTTVIPGVTSLTACAAAANSPLVRRDDVLTVLPGTLPDDVLEARIASADAAAILKVGRHLPRLKVLLARLGLAETSTYVAHATREDQRVVPLTDLDAEDAPYFSMILVSKARA